MLDATPSGSTAIVTLDANRSIMFMPDGRVLFSHVCDRAHRDAGVVRCAPALRIGEGHTIVTREPLTIVASILCPDCGEHGHVTDGVWVGV